MGKILIVDDDSFLLDMYAVKFGEAGYTVDTSKSVEDAIHKMKDGAEYDVVLMDMVMPQLTGIDLLRAIRIDHIGNDPVCIVLSNQGEKADIEMAQEVGVDGYLIKANMIPSEVVAKVTDILQSAQKTKKEKK